MQCIFCKQETSQSRSTEHIVPESLGNRSHILPRGIVCDHCNNYFARDVEKPFLEWPTIKSLRFQQLIPNKSGRVPLQEAIMIPGHPVMLERSLKRDANLAGSSHVVGPKLGNQATVLVPVFNDILPSCTSRFLAKVALEAIAYRLLESGQQAPNLDLAECLLSPDLDPLREHARRGQPIDWPYHSRRIYPVNASWTSNSQAEFQTLHEFDFLQTEEAELYFLLVLFGLELSLNIAGPSIDGYKAWILRHGGASPLYWGKNARLAEYKGVEHERAYWPDPSDFTI